MFEGKIFDAEEATKVLPLITSVMNDVLAAHNELEVLLEEFERNNEIETACLISDEKINEAVERLQDYVEEVEQYGGFVRNSKIGTVDFTGSLNGELVWFCWNVGEPKIAHYHGLKTRCECRSCLKK